MFNACQVRHLTWRASSVFRSDPHSGLRSDVSWLPLRTVVSRAFQVQRLPGLTCLTSLQVQPPTASGLTSPSFPGGPSSLGPSFRSGPRLDASQPTFRRYDLPRRVVNTVYLSLHFAAFLFLHLHWILVSGENTQWTKRFI